MCSIKITCRITAVDTDDNPNSRGGNYYNTYETAEKIPDEHFQVNHCFKNMYGHRLLSTTH
jgi:hypothetical protein